MKIRVIFVLAIKTCKFNLGPETLTIKHVSEFDVLAMTTCNLNLGPKTLTNENACKLKGSEALRD